MCIGSEFLTSYTHMSEFHKCDVLSEFVYYACPNFMLKPCPSFKCMRTCPSSNVCTHDSLLLMFEKSELTYDAYDAKSKPCMWNTLHVTVYC
ncbi:hypothetical protein HanRHA438_Chr12g0565121 [Helianthus annuus]|nr:hypothetical protein HanRHA438_Chr12g0565121 [Helianthus annuus]